MNLTFPDWLRNPARSYEYVTWLRKWLDDELTVTPIIKANTPKRSLEVVLFNASNVSLATGIAGDISLDFACTILQWTLLADASGSLVVDIWKDTYANFPPTVADTITASAKPTLSSVNKNRDSTLAGWTTSIAAGDVLRFNIDSVSGIKRATLVLELQG